MTSGPTTRRTAPAKPRSARKAAPKRGGGAASATNPPAAGDTYHHGDLPEALLKAAEVVLERDGLQGLTLRAVAR
jgi:hypothetical protein